MIPEYEGLKTCLSGYAVVGALFATVTYAAQIMPPGGEWGTSGGFLVFYFSNFLAFWFSVALLTAALIATANIDHRGALHAYQLDVNHNVIGGHFNANSDCTSFPALSFEDELRSFERWSEVAFGLQAFLIPMYVFAGIAFVAAGFVLADTDIKRIVAWVSLGLGICCAVIVLYSFKISVGFTRAWSTNLPIMRVGGCRVMGRDVHTQRLNRYE